MKTSKIRIGIILLLFLSLYSILILRLFYWQVVRANDLQDLGRYQAADSLILLARRGEIRSADDFPLATNKPSYLLYANPKIVKDRKDYANKLKDVLRKDEASISAQLDMDLFWVALARNLTNEKKEEVEKLRLEGLGFQLESFRMYPEASLAAHLVGFLGKNELGAPQGYFGLEGYYNEQLKGRSGRLFVVKDALGNPVINDIREEKKIDGRTIVTTIDRTIQYIAEQKLKEGVEKYEADGGSIIIMDPKSGQIKALASFPNFNPESYYEFDSSSYKSPIISSVFEPGSTFKVIVMAAAIDLNKVMPDTKCPICDKPIEISGYKIKTWNDKYYPNTTMTEVIQHSDNTGMVFVGQKLGVDNFVARLKKFGFGQKTEVDLQGEVTGQLRDVSDWRVIDLATASFGQGISITPLQLLAAVNPIANNGKRMKPYLVDKIITDEGKLLSVNPQVMSYPISETTSKVVTWMMVNAVEKGESKWTKIKGLKVAGKTGTAQIPVAGHYDPNSTIASFVGFFPADDPQISMLVLIDKPRTSVYGSETAAPVFFNVAREVVKYLNIPLKY